MAKRIIVYYLNFSPYILFILNIGIAGYRKFNRYLRYYLELDTNPFSMIP